MIKLSRVNTALVVLIVLIDGYIIAAPFAPAVMFWWNSHHTERKQQLVQELQQVSKPTGHGPAKPQPNHVIVPSMLLNTPILEGPVWDQYAILNNGVWRYPLGSTPDKGGNTVLVGHRFTYTNPRGIFYFLNKVKIGDEIGVYWNNDLYRYKVSSIKVVPPSDTAIENPSKKAELTMFTCTPLWLPTHRLVIVANLESPHERQA